MTSGNADKVRGRLKKAAGELTDDDDLRRSGRIDETAGDVKDTVERAVDRTRRRLNRRRR